MKIILSKVRLIVIMFLMWFLIMCVAAFCYWLSDGALQFFSSLLSFSALVFVVLYTILSTYEKRRAKYIERTQQMNAKDIREALKL